jgi:class 3 adenylate cyclase
MSNHGANVVRITALCADLRDLTAASLLETKELEEVITRCIEIQKEAFHYRSGRCLL